MAAPRRELSVDQIRELLAELGNRLQSQGVQASLYIVGGAAIALEFDVRRVTADVDAVFHPATTVRAEAARMATERGLPRNWLNDSARSFIPGGDDGAIRLDVPGLSVALASPEHLLAMKLASYRPGQDQRDLELLFGALAIGSAREAADLALRVYGEASVVLPGRDELVLSAQAIIDRRARRRR